MILSNQKKDHAQYNVNIAAMEKIKKVLICSTCNFFPTKAESGQVIIQNEHVIWDCKLCRNSNIYPKKWLFSLPSSSYLSLSLPNFLPKPAGNQRQNFIVLIKLNSNTSTCYSPLLRQNFLNEKLCQDFFQPSKLQELYSKSIFLSALKRTKTALNKFKSASMNKHDKDKDDKIQLLELYLTSIKGYMYKKSLCMNAGLQIVLTTDHKTFVFCFDTLEVDQQKTLMENFLLIYSLLSIRQVPEWLLQYYRNIFKKYESKMTIEGNIQEILILANQDNLQIQIIKQPSKRQLQIIEDALNSQDPLKKSLPWESIKCGKTQFLKYLKQRTQQIQKLPAQQSINLFFIQRRRSRIEKYCYKGDLLFFKHILLNRKATISNQEQKQLRIQLAKIIFNGTQKQKVSVIKLIAFFYTDGKYEVIMFVFNWSQIQKERFTLTLEEPDTYVQIFQQDAIPAEHPLLTVKTSITPFSKKRVIGEAYSHEDNEQIEESGQFTSL